MLRQTVDDICIGDKFKDEYGDVFTVKSFAGCMSVFLECSDMHRDTYLYRDEKLLSKINNYANRFKTSIR